MPFGKERILKAIEESENPPTQRELSRSTKLPRPFVRATVVELEREGKIEIEEVGNTHLHRRVEDDS
jgi:uncharacterized membrane protein